MESGERPRNPPTTELGGLQVRHKDLAFGAFSPYMRHSEIPSELKEIALEVLEEWEGGPQDPLWIRPTFDGHVSQSCLRPGSKSNLAEKLCFADDSSR